MLDWGSLELLGIIYCYQVKCVHTDGNGSGGGGGVLIKLLDYLAPTRPERSVIEVEMLSALL